MKAKIKATGEVVTLKILYTDGTAIDTNGRYYRQGDISEFIEESNDSIDWEQRRYELAKKAMGAFIASPSYQFCANNNYYEASITPSEHVAKDAVDYADALISELKKSEPKDEFSSIVEQAPNLYRALSEIETRVRISTNVDWKVLSLKIRDIALSAIEKCK